MIKEITKYITDDGKEFSDFDDAQNHESAKTDRDAERYARFVQGYTGRTLLAKYGPSKYGTWEILGEDDNCDLGGYHYMPRLGVYEGTLDQVIHTAVSLPSFFSWGGGGSINFVNPPEVLKL